MSIESVESIHMLKKYPILQTYRPYGAEVRKGHISDWYCVAAECKAETKQTGELQPIGKHL